MKAAIFYSGKFGSTRQYAYWLGEATGLPVFSIHKGSPEPWNYDLLILGTSIIVGKPTIAKWMKRNWEQLWGRKLLLFSVSGTRPGHPNLDAWMTTHLGEEILRQVKYVPLRGRLILDELPWWLRLMVRLASRVEKDSEAKERMSEGFDYLDRESLDPILVWYQRQVRPVSPPQIPIAELV
jgi:menaquinone-dependent protoporphyrinogen IX oxidase